MAALAAGASAVAPDLSGVHLDVLWQRVPPVRRRLTLRVGRFPVELGFPAGAFDAVHAARMFHFLPPADVEAGLARAFDWLAPGGRLFLHASTPYDPDTADFIPVFEARKAAGERWPGVVVDPARHAEHNLPPLLHYFDADPLARAARRAGFRVVSCREFTAANLPDYLRLDGRECVHLIARKPAKRRTARPSRDG
jgi:SAM-dependent methyltransferase